MIYLNVHYKMRRHGLKGQQPVAVLGLPLNGVIFKLYGETEFFLYEIEQLAGLFDYSLDYLVGHRMMIWAYSSGEGMDSIMRG